MIVRAEMITGEDWRSAGVDLTERGLAQPDIIRK